MDEREVHRIVSRIFSAPIFSFCVVPLFAYFPGEGLGQLDPLSSVLIGWIFLGCVPLSVIFYAKMAGWSEDFSIPRRGKRTRVFLLVIASYLVSASIFLHFSNHLMFMISLAYVTVTTCMTLVNVFWKISIHAAGIAGPTTALVYVFGAEFSLLYLFLIPVSVSRFRLKVHSKLQLLAGAILSMIVTFLVYLALY